MYYLLTLYLIIVFLFSIVVYVDLTDCLTKKLPRRDWFPAIMISIFWPITTISMNTKKFWIQAWWALQLRRGKLLQVIDDPTIIIQYRNGAIYYYNTIIPIRHSIIGTSWRIYRPITFKEL